MDYLRHQARACVGVYVQTSRVRHLKAAGGKPIQEKPGPPTTPIVIVITIIVPYFLWRNMQQKQTEKRPRLSWKWNDTECPECHVLIIKGNVSHCLISLVVESSWKFFNYKIIGNDIKPWLVQILLYWHPFGKENITSSYLKYPLSPKYLNPMLLYFYPNILLSFPHYFIINIPLKNYNIHIYKIKYNALKISKM